MKRFCIWFGVIFILSLFMLMLTLHMTGYDVESIMLNDVKSSLWMIICCMGLSMTLGSLSFLMDDK